jgi:hypothetical protein
MFESILQNNPGFINSITNILTSLFGCTVSVGNGRGRKTHTHTLMLNVYTRRLKWISHIHKDPMQISGIITINS